MAPGDTPSNAPDTRVEAVPAQLAAPETTDAAAETVRKKAEEQRLAVQKRETVGKESEVGATERAAGSPTEADNQAAEAIVTALDGARVAFGAKLDAFEATVDSNNFLVKGTVQNEIKRARQELAALVGTERGKGSIGKTLKEAIQARDAGDFQKTRQLLSAAQKAIMGKMDMIIAKKSEIGPLSQESKVAYTALADEASRLMPGIQTAFNQRETSLKAIEVAGTAPAVAKATGTTPPALPVVNQTEQPPQQTTTVSTGPTTGPATGPATTTGLPDALALPQKAQELIAQFPSSDPFLPMYSSLTQAINGFKPGFNWFWRSTEAIQQKAAKQALLTQCESLKSFLEKQWSEVQTKTKKGDLVAAKGTLKSMADAFAKFHDDAVSQFSAVPDITPVTTALQKSKEDANAEGLRWFQSLSTIQSEIDTAKAQAAAAQQKPPEAPVAPVAKPEETTSKPEEEVKLTPAEEKAQKIESMTEQITQIKATALEAYSKNPPDMPALIMVGFQALTLLLSAFGEGGDLLAFGEAMAKALGGEKKLTITSPNQLLTLVLSDKEGKTDETTEDAIDTFRRLPMKELYAFYKDPTGDHPDMDPDILKKLQAFRAGHLEEFQTLMGDLFNKYGGEACTKDPDQKEKTVMDFIRDKMTKWGASLPKELLAKARGTDKKE
ncbi:MAG: hypothetical protein WCW30_02105, partial [Candidatus Gracilibacteria bacterium]